MDTGSKTTAGNRLPRCRNVSLCSGQLVQSPSPSFCWVLPTQYRQALTSAPKLIPSCLSLGRSRSCQQLKKSWRPVLKPSVTKSITGLYLLTELMVLASPLKEFLLPLYLLCSSLQLLYAVAPTGLKPCWAAEGLCVTQVRMLLSKF